MTDALFCKTDLSDSLFRKINGISYKTDCQITRDDLSHLKIPHYGFQQDIRCGELIVNQKIADRVLAVFFELFKLHYPIEKICLIEEYGGDDEASMADNNSSAFNCRFIDGTNTPSSHGLGLAIDINPLYNPYVRTGLGKRNILPLNAIPYADRMMPCPYYIHKGDACYLIFKKHGFQWGGDWEKNKDYQHFQAY